MQLLLGLVVEIRLEAQLVLQTGDFPLHLGFFEYMIFLKFLLFIFLGFQDEHFILQFFDGDLLALVDIMLQI